MTEPRSAALARRHGLWLGPLLAVAGFLSYFLVFARWPATRDTPWVNLVILGAAMGLSFAGLRTAWTRGVVSRVAGVASVLFSIACTGLLLAYCYGLSSTLPDAELAAHDGDRIPDITLLADDGTPVDLQGVAAGRLILVFYRGFW